MMQPQTPNLYGSCTVLASQSSSPRPEPRGSKFQLNQTLTLALVSSIGLTSVCTFTCTRI